MDVGPIFIVVQGLFEKSDSVGYDAVFEYKMLREIYGKSRVRLFAERFDPKLYLGVPIVPIGDLWAHLKKTPDATIVYHYCDGWTEIDEFLLTSRGNFVVRWHNNTPPWFYATTHRRSMERTTAGFRTILRFIANPDIKFWVNSNFTFNQLCVLGADPARAAVVYPGSRFLESQRATSIAPDRGASELSVTSEDQPFRLLFVSRVVAHKGHRHVVMFASALQNALGRAVSVTFLGRDDPATTLKSDLSALGKAEGVGVLLKGEVSEDTLCDAYRQADLFVCFSEHEGFGMPIFEAMRVGLPVMCLGRTALRELMKDHPFMLDDLDLARAISATRLLADRETRGKILEIQSSILQSYTSQVVAEQLVAAMAGVHGPWTNASTDSSVSFADVEKIRVQIVAGAVETAECFAQPIEISDNFVTVYDIQSYDSLLDRAGSIATLRPDDVSVDQVTLSHRDFVTIDGVSRNDGIAFSAASANRGPAHVIYGPYEKFVRGYFAADFEIEAETNGDESVELELDVLVDGARRVAKRKVTVKSINAAVPPRLLFPISTEGATVEFRIKVSRHGNCNLLFKGVTIRKMREAVAGLRDRDSISLLKLPWFKFKAPFGSSLGGIPPLARRHFARGDQLRDRGQWNDAADCYAHGLNYYPAAFAALVELGNCLKEAERYEESEKAYQQALAIKPNDRGAHLQIARLYRSCGRPEEFNFHLLRAARVDRTTAEALLELGEEGTSAGFVSKLLTN